MTHTKADAELERVAHLADLARLSLTKEETKRYAREFREIVAYVDAVQQVPVSQAPLTHTISGVQHVLRDDAVADSGLRAELLACAPETENGSVKVPAVR